MPMLAGLLPMPGLQEAFERQLNAAIRMTIFIGVLTLGGRIVGFEIAAGECLPCSACGCFVDAQFDSTEPLK